MMDDSSNTTPKQQGGVTGKGFVKGDPRINRKGRPKSFDALRELAQQIAHETPTGKDGQQLEVNGHLVTYAEFILRNWATSADPRKQQAFMDVAYGKVPQKTEVTGADGGPVQTEAVVKIYIPDNARQDTDGH